MAAHETKRPAPQGATSSNDMVRAMLTLLEHRVSMGATVAVAPAKNGGHHDKY
jgi:hypothetical protein